MVLHKEISFGTKWYKEFVTNEYEKRMISVISELTVVLFLLNYQYFMNTLIKSSVDFY